MSARMQFPSDPYDGEEYTNAGRTWVFLASVPAWRPKKIEVLTPSQAVSVEAPQVLTQVQQRQALANIGATPVQRTEAQGAPDVEVLPVAPGQLCIVGTDPETCETYVAVQVSPPVWVKLRTGDDVLESPGIQPSDEGFAVTPRAALKTLVAEDATVDDLVDVLATLIETLKTKQVI